MINAPRHELAVTWQHPVSRSIQPVALLTFDGSRYAFHYIRNAATVTDFQPLIGFPDLTRTYESARLFPLFAQRAMDPRRPDFGRYVARLGLDDDATPWEQIARSEGRRQGDTLQLFPEPVVDADGTLRCSFLVHGVRHVFEDEIIVDDVPRHVSRQDLEAELSGLRPGDPLRLVAEPGNPANPNSLLTTTIEGFPIGWLPDLLVEDLQMLPTQDVSVTVEQANGPDTVWHLRVLARLAAPTPPGFQPFRSTRWLPYGDR